MNIQNILNIKRIINNKQLIISTLLFFVMLQINAQFVNNPFCCYKYNFIKQDSCAIENYGENQQLHFFYNKLRNYYLLGNENISILHLGDSHIQAGIICNQMRNLFENLMPNSNTSMGFVFPFSIAKTNHPVFYRSKTEGNWEFSKITDKVLNNKVGLAGISAATTDSIASISIYFNKYAQIETHKFNRISIFHNIEDTCYEIKIIPETNVDSILINQESGTSDFYLSQKIDSLKLIIKKKYSTTTKFIFYGAYLYNDKPSFCYSLAGINGANTNSWANAEMLEQHLNKLKPDLVILSLAVNDAINKDFSETYFIQNYSKLIEKIRRVNPQVAIIFTTNNDFYIRKKINQNYPKIYSSLQSLSNKYNCSIWNMYNIMGGHKSINAWQTNNLAHRDKVHFTGEGYTIIAQLMFEAIIKDYEQYLKK